MMRNPYHSLLDGKMYNTLKRAGYYDPNNINNPANVTYLRFCNLMGDNFIGRGFKLQHNTLIMNVLE